MIFAFRNKLHVITAHLSLSRMGADAGGLFFDLTAVPPSSRKVRSRPTSGTKSSTLCTFPEGFRSSEPVDSEEDKRPEKGLK